MATGPPYDVFISYASGDVEWAAQLEADLIGKNVTVYRDKSRLQSGREWKEQILDAIQQSRHVVVLWSQKARDSDWVIRETGLFDARKASENRSAPGTLMFFISLDVDHRAFSDIQMIATLKQAGAYANGFAQLDRGAGSPWAGAVTQVATGAMTGALFRPVSLAVMAMTQDECNALNPATVPPIGEPLDAVLKRIGLKWDDLKLRYGPKREDWHPFGNASSVMDLLNTVRDQTNAGLDPQARFRWDLLGDHLWSRNLDEANAEIARLMAGPSVLVVDPISLHDQRVYWRLLKLEKCFDLPSCVIIVVPPFEAPPQIVALGKHLREISDPIFDRYYVPPIPFPSSFAVCGVNVSDERDIQRLLRQGLGQGLVRSTPPPGNVFTNTAVRSA